MDILKHKNLTVENWEGFNKIPRWFREAETVNAVISVDPYLTAQDIDDSQITWTSGRWVSGTWKQGIWHNGTWENGVWQYGEWKDGIWLNGRWVTGWWLQGTWVNGKWHGGVWEDGLWISGYRGTRKCFGFDGNDKPIR